MSDEKVAATNKAITDEIEKSFADGSWKAALPGRDILKAYSAKLPNGISYEIFRNMIVSRMVDDNYRPEGMKSVIDQILNAT